MLIQKLYKANLTVTFIKIYYLTKKDKILIEIDKKIKQFLLIFKMIVSKYINFEKIDYLFITKVLSAATIGLTTLYFGYKC